MEPVAPAASASASAAGSWSVVSTTKESEVSAETDAKQKRKKESGGPASAWQLASGDAPGLESDEPDVKHSSGTVMAVAQYAVLVVGLVMVLIGVLVMVANSRPT